MNKFCMAAAGLALGASAATAGGLDRSYTPVDILFEEGNYLEFSAGWTDPNLTGTAATGAIPDVGKDYAIFGAGARIQIFDNVALAIILDQPYGADTEYLGAPAATALGGTSAKASSRAATFLLHYQMNERFSVYGGPRWVNAKGDITLSGLAYGPVSGSVFNFASDTGLGYVLGFALERKELGQRLSVTYHSEAEINFATTENIPVAAGGFGVPVPTGTAKSNTPQSVEIAAQTGLNPTTLLFGSIRWSDWSRFSLAPPAFGRSLASIGDAWTIEVGVGRRFSEKFSGSLAFTHELDGGSVVSPLGPNNGLNAITLGGKYQATERVAISGGMRYTMLGNAGTNPGIPLAVNFRNNDAISFGLKVGINLN